MTNPMALKEERYCAYFGKPVLVAHDVHIKPHIDIYIFTNKEKSQYFYLTMGLEELGFRELLMVTTANEKWPVYFLQQICNYQIIWKKQIKENETFDNAAKIKDAKDFNCAIFLETSGIGLGKEKLKKELGLIGYPLYVYPITKQESECSLKNGTSFLLKILRDKATSVGSVNRKSVV